MAEAATQHAATPVALITDAAYAPHPQVMAEGPPRSPPKDPRMAAATARAAMQGAPSPQPFLKPSALPTPLPTALPTPLPAALPTPLPLPQAVPAALPTPLTLPLPLPTQPAQQALPSTAPAGGGTVRRIKFRSKAPAAAATPPSDTFTPAVSLVQAAASAAWPGVQGGGSQGWDVPGDAPGAQHAQQAAAYGLGPSAWVGSIPRQQQLGFKQLGQGTGAVQQFGQPGQGGGAAGGGTAGGGAGPAPAPTGVKIKVKFGGNKAAGAGTAPESQAPKKPRTGC